MKTETFIRGSAEVTRIVDLRQGDVYKRLIENLYRSTDEIRYGVVREVLNNGNKAALLVSEFYVDGGEAKSEFLTLGGDRELAVFPAEPSELATFLADAVTNQERSLTRAEAAVEKERTKLAETKALVDGTFVASLQSPQFTDALPGVIDAEELENV